MEVCADGIRFESLFDGRYCLCEEEASATVADVEDDAAFLCFESPRLKFSILDNFLPAGNATVAMRKDVAGPQFFHCERSERQHRWFRAPEVHHDGYTGKFPGLDSVLCGCPLVAFVVCEFYTDDVFLVSAGRHGRKLGIHVCKVLFVRATAHAGADDVEEREHARS